MTFRVRTALVVVALTALDDAEGTGLGLSIARRPARRFRGDVGAAHDSGGRFFVTLSRPVPPHDG